jgi:tRNA nucleotidyltransferase/poly(A) polymerase
MIMVQCLFEVMESTKKKMRALKSIKTQRIKKERIQHEIFWIYKSNAPFMKWFDSDDIMLPNHLLPIKY